jgi:hypothetical protein
LSSKQSKNVTVNRCQGYFQGVGCVSGKIKAMKKNWRRFRQWLQQAFQWRGKNSRFYAASAALVGLIGLPFALFGALNQGDSVLSAIFFTMIAGCMAIVLAAA